MLLGAKCTELFCHYMLRTFCMGSIRYEAVLQTVTRENAYNPDAHVCIRYNGSMYKRFPYKHLESIYCYVSVHMMHLFSGITSGRVFNEERYAQRLQKLIYLYLLTGCFLTFCPED